MKAVKPREDRISLGVGTMAVAVTFFTLIDSSAKWLMLAGLPALQVVFARYAGHLAVSLILFLPREGLSALRSRRPRWQLLRALLLSGSTLLNFTALFYLPITVTTTIAFSGPIMVTLLAIPLLGETVGVRRLIAVLVGFLGVLVVMQPWGSAFHPAMFLSVGGMTCAAGYFILTRQLAGIESNATSQIWASALPTVLLAPIVLPGWIWPATGFDMMILGLIGLFGALGHVAATSAHRLADASILAPVAYIQIVLAALAGIFFFDTWPTLWTLIGALIILGAGLYIWKRERALGVKHK